jgi:hypothetical protein
MGRAGTAFMSDMPSQVSLDQAPVQVDSFLRSAQISAGAIRNLRTRVSSIGTGNHRVPVTVNDSEPGNTWICSPHTAYARYAIEELDRFGHPLLTKPLGRLCRAAGNFLWKSGIDNAVAVNNWLLSTNLYPLCDRAALRSWITEATQRWPGHAIWFRSLNPRYTQDWISALVDMGCVLIPSRQVYLYDQVRIDSRSPQNLRRDFRLLGANTMQLAPGSGWSDLDYERAAELYGQLYLDKYSRLNPDYSAVFLRTWCDAGLLDLSGFRDSTGTLQAVIGTFSMADTITAPIVGYNTSEPQKLGLYRLLMATVYRTAAVTQRRINLSAGAAHFKRLRGGVATIEFSAVYVHHLPSRQQRSVSILSFLARRIGEPFMKRFEL